MGIPFAVVNVVAVLAKTCGELAGPLNMPVQPPYYADA